MSRPSQLPLFSCLIRTHHITSRKKIQRVKKAAAQASVDWVLIRSGGTPGIMFAESRDESGLLDWVSAVQALRYKDFRCARRPAPAPAHALLARSFVETDSVSAFAHEMELRGLASWWRKAMAYDAE